MRNRFQAGSPIARIRASSGETEILIYGDIGESFWDLDGDITAKNVKAQLDDAPKGNDIVVRINSPGGDAFEGVAIGNILRDDGRYIIVKVDGTAISSASIIAMAGDEIRMADNALMMIHDPWTRACGDASELRAMADRLDKVAGALAQTYVSRTGKSKDEIRELMAAETWMDAEEALEEGFATHIDSANDDAEAMLTERKIAAYRNVPGGVSRWMRADGVERFAAVPLDDGSTRTISPPADKRGGSTPTQESTVELQEVQAALNKANEKIAKLTEGVSEANARADAIKTQNGKLVEERDALQAKFDATEDKRIEAKVKDLIGKKFAASEFDAQLALAKRDEELFDTLTEQRTAMTVLDRDPAGMGADPQPKPAVASGKGEGFANLVTAATNG